MKELLFLLAVPLVVIECSSQCDTGYVELNSNCFYFHQETRMPWQDARGFCQELGGGDLAIIDQPNTLREIYKYLVKYDLHDPFWIGGSDIMAEGNWTWIDNSDIAYGTPFWALHNGLFGWSHEPSGGNEENCLALDGERKFYFNDHNCNDVLHPICMMH
ncbi:C-type mannose receptor 2-like [Penaeus chinensis]|uniref:C-type mannose receptor 2-like n=1 Tax=Penaeus chinensis TaxID=139456 RepID=UPI001FB5C1E1|nr:C-type mannose receptor 2-like [Penaeus chinensis]